jgi:hypothetical protein
MYCAVIFGAAPQYRTHQKGRKWLKTELQWKTQEYRSAAE